MACNDVEIVENWKNPDDVIFQASKVLLVGMTQNKDTQTAFETRLKEEFDAYGVAAMRSVDVFDVDFTDTRKTDEDLDAMEQSLLDKGFDAILLTKVVGAESRSSFKANLARFNARGTGFPEGYLQDQDIYYDADYYQRHTVYFAETLLYCICQDKERRLVWRSAINVYDPNTVEKTIDDYVDLMVAAMESQDLIFYEAMTGNDACFRNSPRRFTIGRYHVQNPEIVGLRRLKAG